MSAALENEYRKALRWYPAKWRRRNEDAVVGTLLDVAEADDRLTPAPGELADLRLAAVVSHLGPLGRIPAPVRDRAAAIALGLGVALSIAVLVDGGIYLQAARMPVFSQGATFLAGFLLAAIMYVLWISAFVAALAGRRRLVVILLSGAFVTSVPAKALTFHLPWAPPISLIVLLAMTAIVVAVGAPRARVVAVSAAAWTAVTLTLVALEHLSSPVMYWQTNWLVDSLGFAVGLALPLGIVVALVLWRLRRSPWAHAILLVEIPLAIFAVFGRQQYASIVAILAISAAALVTIAGCVAILRGFGIRIRITRV